MRAFLNLLMVFVTRVKVIATGRTGAFLSHRALASIAKPTMPGRVLAIRREDQSVWERRAPLAPQHVRELVKNGVKVIIQPSNRRAYTMGEYQGAGATVQEELDEAPVVLGVKQVPIDSLLPNKTYVFFSHTIKAQQANMPLLDAILEKQIRLVDYERFVDERNQRLVAFGQYAGIAGMINILHGLGLRLLALGHHTPFLHVGLPHNYRNSEMAKQAIRDAGYEISRGRLPASLGPLTFVFTGAGNVSRGAQEVFQELPHEYVEPATLPRVAQHGSNKKVYGCVVDRKDNLVRKPPSDMPAALLDQSPSSTGNPLSSLSNNFDDEEFVAHPERYVSNFATRIAPHASVIINGVFWNAKMPRLLTLADAKALMRPSPMPFLPERPGCPRLPHRLVAIADISADPGGSIQFMQECTSIDAPFTLYDPDMHAHGGTFSGPGVLVCSIDNMPTQLPREATDFFGALLFPFIGDLLKSDATTPLEQFDAQPAVKKAVITSNGELAPDYQYISALRASRRKQEGGKKVAPGTIARKKVLMLGAGFVAGPAVEYLARDNSVRLTIASQFMEEATRLATRHPEVEPALLDITQRPDELQRLVKDHDLVVSLLPAPLHPTVARLCLKYRKHLVTTSYVSPEMQALDKAAREANVTLLNEIGLDPGIDHLLAARCLDELREAGSRVESFVSWCGGLPAPECSDNPLRYKFSWAPRNVIANLMMGARWLQNGEVRQVGNGGAILDAATDLHFLPGFALEGIPNRDSVRYQSVYDLGKSVHTCLRGTLRYRGFTHAMKAITRIGLASDRPHPSLHPTARGITWRRLLAELCGRDADMFDDTLKSLLLQQYLGGNEQLLGVLVELGLLDDTLPIEKRGTPVDTLANYLAKRLSFGPQDRDFCLLRHDITSINLGGQRQTHSYTLAIYGTPATQTSPPVTAMARCVGVSAGIAAKMLIDGEIERRGVILPLTPDCYRPMLARLAQEGIQATENVTRHTANDFYRPTQPLPK